MAEDDGKLAQSRERAQEYVLEAGWIAKSSNRASQDALSEAWVATGHLCPRTGGLR